MSTTQLPRHAKAETEHMPASNVQVIPGKPGKHGQHEQVNHGHANREQAEASAAAQADAADAVADAPDASPDAPDAGASVPTDEDFDWSTITGETVTRLRGRKIVPVPEHIVKLAQQSYDGVEKDGKILHIMQHPFDTEERAAKFAKHMRNAGDHTTPISTVSVVIDPDNTGNKKLVAWQAGQRRGRKSE